MSGPFKALVEKRKALRERIPKFLRVNYYRYEKIDDSWRKQRGRHNTIRLSIKGAGNKPKIGYGVVKEARGIHPSGYKEVLVHNVKDLEDVDPNSEAIRISSSVGLKKRLEILNVAKEKGIKVLNDNILSRVKKKGFSSVKDFIESLNAPKSKEVKKDSSMEGVKKGEDVSKEIKEDKDKDKKKEEGSKRKRANSTKAKSAQSTSSTKKGANKGTTPKTKRSEGKNKK